MDFHDLAYHGQAQSISFGGMGSISLVKFIEDMPAGFFVHAAAGVLNGHFDPAVLHFKDLKNFFVIQPLSSVITYMRRINADHLEACLDY